MATPHPPQPHNHHLHQIPIKIAARKLPVKRKTPSSPPNPNPILPPKPDSLPSSDPNPVDKEDADLKPPPFKFHRIWSESDEIRFLQALLDSSALGLVFPRDLNVFYERFSQPMPQPYTKSQLSEKLRRLRKKFRVVSARLARGLDASLLTPHDRSLLHLSKQLWHPAFAASSPFTPFIASNDKKPAPSRVTVTVNSSPLPSPPPPAAVANSTPSPPPPPPPPPPPLYNDGDFNGEEDFQSGGRSSGGIGLGRAAAKTVMDVFDQSLKEVRMVLVRRGLHPDHTDAASFGSNQGKASDLTKKWREQRVAELDVLARRLRLVLEHTLHE